MAHTKVHVKTSTSGRRFVEIDEVIKRRLAQIKKSRNGGSGKEHHTSSGKVAREEEDKHLSAFPTR